MTIRRKLIDDAFTLAVLFLATGAFQSFLVDPTDPKSATDGSTFLQLVWFLIYVLVAFRLIPHYREIIVLVRANKCLLLLVLLAVSSMCGPKIPVSRCVTASPFLATTLIGIDFAIRYSVRDQLRLVCIVLGLVVLLGIVAQLFFPALIPNGDFDMRLGMASWPLRTIGPGSWFSQTPQAFSRSHRSLRDYWLLPLFSRPPSA